MSAWDDFLARLPMRMRRTMEDGDVGIAFRAICIEFDELRKTLRRLTPDCLRCNGTGIEPGTDEPSCGRCNGAGKEPS